MSRHLQIPAPGMFSTESLRERENIDEFGKGDVNGASSKRASNISLMIYRHVPYTDTFSRAPTAFNSS